MGSVHPSHPSNTQYCSPESATARSYHPFVTFGLLGNSSLQSRPGPPLCIFLVRSRLTHRLGTGESPVLTQARPPQRLPSVCLPPDSRPMLRLGSVCPVSPEVNPE